MQIPPAGTEWYRGGLPGAARDEFVAASLPDVWAPGWRECGAGCEPKLPESRSDDFREPGLYV